MNDFPFFSLFLIDNYIRSRLYANLKEARNLTFSKKKNPKPPKTDRKALECVSISPHINGHTHTRTRTQTHTMLTKGHLRRMSKANK